MAPAGRTQSHWPALDGIRAVAVALVVAYHLSPEAVQRGGSIGVTTFFTLSGFLITSLLLAESEGTGTVSLRRFYLRRALRLLPALVVLVPVVVAYALWSGRADDTVAAVPAVVLYVSNWVRAVSGFDTLGLFEHAWSLAVEEQFYLVWPLVLLAVGAVVGRRDRARAVLLVALAGSAASLAWRLVLWDGNDPAGSAARLYNGTDTVADQLLIGAALAAAVRLLVRRRAPTSSPHPPPSPAARGVGSAAGIGLSAPMVAGLSATAPAALGFLVWVAIERPGGATVANNRLYLTWGATAFAVAAAVVVLAGVAAPASPLSRLLSVRPLVAVGRVSYGIYLWHYPVILAVQAELPDAGTWGQRTISLAVTALAVTLSWRLVERPWLARKERLAPTAPVRPDTAARPSPRAATAPARP